MSITTAVAEATYISEAEVRRAWLFAVACEKRLNEIQAPPQGDPATLEALLQRGEAYLRQYPQSQAAHTRVALLSDEWEKRWDAWYAAMVHFEALAHALEKVQGHVCPEIAAANAGKAFTGICWQLAESQGWQCARRKAMEGT